MNPLVLLDESRVFETVTRTMWRARLLVGTTVRRVFGLNAGGGGVNTSYRSGVQAYSIGCQRASQSLPQCLCWNLCDEFVCTWGESMRN